MKKISLLLFFVSVFPTASLAYDCTGPSPYGQDYEYSECAFLNQRNLTDAVKKFWGNPKHSYIVESNGSGIGDFILTSGMRCGNCGRYEDDDEGKSTKFVSKSGEQLMFFSCPDSNKQTDDVALLAYVATDVSEHGAEFCLTQFSSHSWRKTSNNPAKFFVDHQMPRSTSSRNGLKCEWYCESGWGGDRCMTKGIDAVCSSISYNFGSIRIDTLADVKKHYKDDGRFCKDNDMRNHCLAEFDSTDPVIGRTAVFDFKTEKDSVKVEYQQQVVIGATEFLDYGIKAKPIQLGAYGTHSSCVAGAGTLLSATTAGGQERTLCLRGYVLQGGKCVKACSTEEGAKPLCRINQWSSSFGFSESKFDPEKHYRSYYAKSDCVIFKCLNGMNFTPDDEYACSICKNTVRQGLCPSTNKCMWCNVGQCFNPSTCKCDACASVLTKDQMRFGPNKTDECWSIVDADEFRACVIGDTVSE